MDIDFPEPSLVVINQFLNVDILNLFLQASILLFLLVFSAIISGSEVAFFSLSQTEIKKYAKEKNKRLTNANLSVTRIQFNLVDTSIFKPVITNIVSKTIYFFSLM